MPSLCGGTLLMTPLKGADNQIYVVAQGNIIVGGVGASAGGGSVKVNQLADGRISGGAIIERELASQFGKTNSLNLQLNEENFSLAQTIADTINRIKGIGTATVLDARTVQLRLPARQAEQVRFLAQIQNMSVKSVPIDAKIILNAHTGSVVMNCSVMLDNCAISQGGLSITVDRRVNVSQPDTPFAGGKTVVTRSTDIANEKHDGLHKVNASANLNELIWALNALDATPTDLMSILQAMESAGCLRAKLEII